MGIAGDLQGKVCSFLVTYFKDANEALAPRGTLLDSVWSVFAT